MKNSLFRYFERAEFAEDFVSGNLRFQTLEYYQQIEDLDRRDEGEGQLIFQPRNGLEITKLTQRTKSMAPGWRLESKVESGNIFVCCISKAMSDRLVEKFSASAVVEIFSPPIFCGKVKKAISLGEKFYAGKVQYINSDRLPGADWALPEKIAFLKQRRFSEECEFRIAIGKSEVFDVENVELRLTNESHFMDTSRTENIMPRIISVGSLDSICRLHLL